MSREYMLAIFGGILIGFASALPLWWHGKVAGASGLLSNLLLKSKTERASGLYYAVGLIAGALLLLLVNEDLVSTKSLSLNLNLIIGALLVGFGSRLGSGCTSGHGVCGMARFSKRSIVATLSFLGTAMIVANIVKAIT